MAHELFLEQASSPATDIYALGILMSHLVNQKYPIKGKNLADIKHAHKHHQYTQLNHKNQPHPKEMIE
jgi:serine/threonine protein kinase